MRAIVTHVIERLLESSSAITAPQVAAEAGVSRQAAHKHLARMVRSGALTVTGKARASRYRRPEAAPQLLRTRLQVASAGSLYRLSARMLLDGVTSGEAVLDFTGVADVSEEFLEEIFVHFSAQHPAVSLKVAHLPARLAPMFMAFAKRVRAQREAAEVAAATQAQPILVAAAAKVG